jgi:hypothetical protein
MSAPAARAAATVPSREPSEQTITSRRSRGQRSASAFSTFAAITASSSWAQTISETRGEAPLRGARRSGTSEAAAISSSG